MDCAPDTAVRELLATFLAGAVLIACSPRQVPAPQGVTAPQAANFVRDDLDHHRIELKQLRGKVVLLNFWATWCGPCMTEVPKFIQWQRELGPREFQVIGVSMDDSKSDVIAMAEKMPFNYPVVMGDEELARSYGGVFGIPISFLIDRDGRIAQRYQGVKLPKLHADILALLNSKHGVTPLQ
jgi:peroxiredoxin